MSVQGMGRWALTAGDPLDFSVTLGFAANPHDPDHATAEERASWGYFEIWAGGENLCAHVEQSAVLPTVHWYMLPLIEWFADNWDPLLHEEWPPLRNEDLSAARSLMRTKTPPPSQDEVNELRWLDRWSAWWRRHNIRAGADGGLFPDLYLRRFQDRVEVSTGREPLQYAPEHVYFLTPDRTYLINPVDATRSLFTVLEAATQQLQARLPHSDRIARLVATLRDLAAEERRSIRLAWAAGLGDDPERFRQLGAELDAVLAPVPADVRQQLAGSAPGSELIAYGTPYARLLFGAVSPSMTARDVTTLARLLVDNYLPAGSQRLDVLDLGELRELAAATRRLSPAEQGSQLGERACELFAAGSEPWVDVRAVLDLHDIAVSEVDLSDGNVRAVTVFGPTQRPHVFCNSTTVWGPGEGARRFTLAHELCHLLLDREHGGELAVASGPWAPVAIERRANAFAAAFLMPSRLLRGAIAPLDRPVADGAAITSLASTFRVSVSALANRLYNLGEIAGEERERLLGL
ncbi:MAG: ImmA/IrrE family metallo-endopeptidase [Actinobacteria bacterium]|nr:ImmA/IrrE family metallo-endopeptidase [Actinomycetota bacterium]MBI3688816.1 ImmA/IrrE family metallo-endopeptidase [Actinomycetota bacterium]